MPRAASEQVYSCGIEVCRRLEARPPHLVYLARRLGGFAVGSFDREFRYPAAKSARVDPQNLCGAVRPIYLPAKIFEYPSDIVAFHFLERLDRGARLLGSRLRKVLADPQHL